MSPIITQVALPEPETIVMEYKTLGVELIRSGTQWRTLCPFPDHIDSKPSFFVYPDGGYHCFGCGAHGSLEDIYTFFEIDFSYHLSRIDLTTIQDSAIGFMPQLRKNLERRICLAVENSSKNCFKVYDLFDRMWIDLRFLTFINRLNMAIVVKRKFYNLLQRLEDANGRKERNEFD